MTTLQLRRTTTKYEKSIKVASSTMLKPGHNNKKLGGTVKVKHHQHKPIFSLSLVERLTCPSDCAQWDNCYGNNMPFAHRFDPSDPYFYQGLQTQIDKLMKKYPDGILLRLHVLGDFFDEDYVRFWHERLREYPKLAIFGYTHHDPHNGIGRAVNVLRLSHLGRFDIRFSDRPDYGFSAQVYSKAEDVPQTGDYVICPEQLGQTPSCSECGLCWSQPARKIAFLEH